MLSQPQHIKMLGLFFTKFSSSLARGYKIGVTKSSEILLTKIPALGKALEQKNPLTKDLFAQIAGVGKVSVEYGPEVLKKTVDTIKNNPSLAQEGKSVVQVLQEVSGDVGKGTGNAIQARGKAFEEFLVEKLGGKGSFTAKSANASREFDGAIGNIWYEAKSGEFWDMLLSSKKRLDDFKGDMGRGLSVSRANGATYELHSNAPIPQPIKEWLTGKGIRFTEWL